MAIEANLTIKSSKEEINAALATKKQSRSGFLPAFNATYQYKRNDEEAFITEAISSLNAYNFSASFTQATSPSGIFLTRSWRFMPLQ